MSNELSAAEIVALGKVVSAKRMKEASAELSVGSHDVDFLVQVVGQVKRGEDYEQEIVLKADPWTILAAALSHLNGVTVKSLVKEALSGDQKLVSSIKEQAKEAMAEISAPTRTSCNGKVTTKGLRASGLS